MITLPDIWSLSFGIGVRVAAPVQSIHTHCPCQAESSVHGLLLPWCGRVWAGENVTIPPTSIRDCLLWKSRPEAKDLDVPQSSHHYACGPWNTLSLLATVYQISDMTITHRIWIRLGSRIVCGSIQCNSASSCQVVLLSAIKLH